MIERDGKFFNDDVLRPYSISKHVISNFKLNQCDVMVVSGMPEGIGKSAYVNGALADMQGFFACKEPEKLQWLWNSSGNPRPAGTPIWSSDWEGAKKFVMYPPEEIVDLCMDMLENGKRECCLHWDTLRFTQPNAHGRRHVAQCYGIS